ncbi:ADP-glyceromanno-heptose 6-epimerase [Caulobacter sp. 602-2]|uniref:ADP-L-glycero-D-manno-heptose-6-epimerase n=1 Tax=Caulobacter sp. 602-2 TaxID=2710887 RepID=A0A6G4QR33_9CAUL|nr:ADP-glyceromanno-heptose 6-epimerase [Caulobacter sp. 602-2]NGM48080.1 ADP-glyceromanno-heptose 6-epimerase [Caulobacter sp. 602-2]
MSRRIVLVTGGAGFIGSNIVAKLCEDPALDVVVCDWLGQAGEGKWRNIAKHPIADFVAPEQMFDWLAERGAEVELVIHMGAISSTTEADADLIVQSNFVLSRDIWRWCARNGVRLIYASSAATYGDGTQGFDGKDDIDTLMGLRPLNAYGWSKALFDVFAVREAARGHAPPQWAGLKFFNVYGPNEDHKGGMKSVVCQIWPKIAAGEGVRLFKSHHSDYEDGGQLRDFVYVRDVADVIAWLAKSPHVNGVYNLGSGHARSFKDLAEATFAAVAREPDITYFDMPEVLQGKYQYFTQADMSRLRAAGYNAPMTSLEDGVADYVAGFLNTDDPYR